MNRNIIIIGIPALSISDLSEFASGDISSFKELNSEAIEKLKSSEAALISIYVPIGGDLMRQAPHLKYIGVYGTNLKNVDVDAAHSLGITVNNVSQYCDYDTAEWVITELLCAARGVLGSIEKSTPFSLREKSIGFIGSGGVGKEAIRFALALGMQVSYCNQNEARLPPSPSLKFLDKAELLKSSSIISLHTPPFTEILSDEDFDRIKPGSVLVSTVQGRAWSSSGLERWLLSSAKNRLILDAFAFSQLSNDEKQQLKDRPNVRISPVAAYATSDSAQRIRTAFLTSFKAFFEQRLNSG